MTERQHDRDQIPAEQQGSRLSTADMAAAGRNAADPASPTPRLQDDAVPIEAEPQVPQMAPANPSSTQRPAATTQSFVQPTQAPAAGTPPAQAASASAAPAPAPAAATPNATPPAQAAPRQAQNNAGATALLPEGDTRAFRTRWDAIQTGFVDEPRRSVEQADSLVAEVMQHLAQVFASERAKLEGQWSRGDDVSTEDLRIALRRYRSFFDRLLSM